MEKIHSGTSSRCMLDWIQPFGWDDHGRTHEGREGTRFGQTSSKVLLFEEEEDLQFSDWLFVLLMNVDFSLMNWNLNRLSLKSPNSLELFDLMLLNWRLLELFSPLFYVNYRHYLVRHRLLGGSPKISLFYIEIMNSTLIHYLKSSAWIRNLTLFNDMQYLYVGLAIYFPISKGIVRINKLLITFIRFNWTI